MKGKTRCKICSAGLPFRSVLILHTGGQKARSRVYGKYWKNIFFPLYLCLQEVEYLLNQWFVWAVQYGNGKLRASSTVLHYETYCTDQRIKSCVKKTMYNSTILTLIENSSTNHFLTGRYYRDRIASARTRRPVRGLPWPLDLGWVCLYYATYVSLHPTDVSREEYKEALRYVRRRGQGRTWQQEASRPCTANSYKAV